MSKTSKVLILGAGAGGLVTGYYFTRAGVNVTFYVRPQRISELQPPQLLYSYDDCELKSYEDFKLICDIEEARNQDYDFVISTLDGHSACSEEGSQLLIKLGRALQGTATVIVNMGVYSGIKEHFAEKTGIPENRIILGTFGFLSHFVAGAELDKIAHGPVITEELAKAKVAYRHIGGKGGLVVSKENKSAAQKFTDLYNRNGFSTCAMISPVMANFMFNLMFPLLAACELAGWPAPQHMVKEKYLWSLGCKAVSEIAALPKFGTTGKVLSKVLGARLWRMVWLKISKDSLPLDFNVFNKIHHGEKVVEQDTEVLRQNLAEGQKAGIAMPKLTELLQQLDAHRG